MSASISSREGYMELAGLSSDLKACLDDSYPYEVVHLILDEALDRLDSNTPATLTEDERMQQIAQRTWDVLDLCCLWASSKEMPVSSLMILRKRLGKTYTDIQSSVVDFKTIESWEKLHAFVTKAMSPLSIRSSTEESDLSQIKISFNIGFARVSSIFKVYRERILWYFIKPLPHFESSSRGCLLTKFICSEVSKIKRIWDQSKAYILRSREEEGGDCPCCSKKGKARESTKVFSEPELRDVSDLDPGSIDAFDHFLYGYKRFREVDDFFNQSFEKMLELIDGLKNVILYSLSNPREFRTLEGKAFSFTAINDELLCQDINCPEELIRDSEFGAFVDQLNTFRKTVENMRLLKIIFISSIQTATSKIHEKRKFLKRKEKKEEDLRLREAKGLPFKSEDESSRGTSIKAAFQASSKISHDFFVTRKISAAEFLSKMVLIKPVFFAETAYKNAVRNFESLIYHLEQSDPTYRSLELINFMIEASQMLEQLLTAIARQKAKDDKIREHSYFSLLDAAGISESLLSGLEKKVLRAGNRTEILSRNIPCSESYSKNFFLMKRIYMLDSGNPMGGTDNLNDLTNEVIFSLKESILVYCSLHRYLGRELRVEKELLDGFFASLPVLQDSGARSAASLLDCETAASSSDAPMTRLAVLEETFAGAQELKMSIFFNLKRLRHEQSRENVALLDLHTSLIELHCYNLLENICAYLLRTIDIRHYRHNFKTMLKAIGSWESLSLEEQTFLQEANRYRVSAKYRLIEGDAFAKADGVAQRVRKRGVSSHKPKGREGVVSGEAHAAALSRSNQISTLTMEIVNKLIPPFSKE
jgi:hypothetical protein